jgi:hypothetical protein
VETVDLAVLEALSDTRVSGSDRSLPVEELDAELGAMLPGASWRSLEEQGLVEHWGDRVQLVVDGRSTLDDARTGRRIEWAMHTLSQGEVLIGFAEHCREQLDDVDVVDEGPSRLTVRCKREQSSLELRAGFLFCDRLPDSEPLLLLGELSEPVVERLLADEGLRTTTAVYDLARLEKVNAVRSSVFVYFEWFLRDSYGVKLVPAGAFTQGLVDRGIISLGMG